MSPDANRPPVERRVGVRRAGARGGALGGAALAGDVLLSELAPLLLGGAAPHAGVLVGGEGVLEARGLGLELPAHGLAVPYLLAGGALGAPGEEEVGIGFANGRTRRARWAERRGGEEGVSHCGTGGVPTK